MCQITRGSKKKIKEILQNVTCRKKVYFIYSDAKHESRPPPYYLPPRKIIFKLNFQQN